MGKTQSQAIGGSEKGPTHPSRPGVSRLGLLGLASLILILISLNMGSTSLSPGEVWNGLINADDSTASRIIHAVRLPRALSAFFIGGLLGLAGALFQVLVRNPLAEPYVMGTAGGAAAFYLSAALAGLTPALHPLAAFFGAAFSTAMVAWFSRTSGSIDPLRLLLTGVMIAAGWGALIMLLLSLSPTHDLPGMLFWLLGDLNDTDRWPLAMATLALGIPLAGAMSRALNLLAFGNLSATALGIQVNRIQWGAFLLASLLTGIAVSVAGPIGFVGLVAPHLIRRTIGTDHRILLPGSAFAGGCLLLIADAIVRTATAPFQLPVGVVTALIGVPAFLALLATSGGRQRDNN